VPIKKVQQIMMATKEINQHGEIAVRNMRKDGGSSLNLFSQMLAAADGEQNVRLTDKDVKDEAGNLIVAGSDTTAVTLTYLVWAVLKQPQLQSQLEHELSQLSDGLSNAELESATLLNSVIEETLRLYGAAPGALPRVVPEQGATIGGYHIPGGVEVSTQAYTNHRDPLVFANPLQ
jgi:cytochrome P450